MPTTKRRARELAKAKAARQADRQQANQKRKRRVTAIVATTLLAALVIGTVLGLTLSGGSDKKSVAAASPSASPTTAATKVACGAKAPAPVKTMTFKTAPPLTIDTKASYTMTMTTSCGAIPIELFASKAPQTVNALSFLAGKGYFDGSFCHRETGKEAGFVVLQCGDPTGTGSGGPGFTLAEENLKGATYGRGYVAMAKTQAAHSTGSQFFLLDSDAAVLAQPSPTYTVVGKMTADGLKVLDTIIKLGQNNANGTGDGAPSQKVYIDKLTVTKT